MLVKKIALALILITIVFFTVGLFLPRMVHVERSTVIDAPRATVFTLVNTFRTFNRWSPWFARDPQAAYVFEGPDAGVGAKMRWTSDKPAVGSGSQQIFESKPFESVRSNLDFGAQGAAVATFALTAEGAATRVVWGLDSDLGMNPLSRWFGLAFDRLIGPDYEKGLAALKTLAESLPKADFSDLDVALVTVEPSGPGSGGGNWSGRAARAVHRGPRSDLPATREKLLAYVAAAGLEAAGPSWDQGAGEAGATPEAEPVTHVFVPVK